MTNPPIDPFREKSVMSLACPVGPEANILEPSNVQCHRLWLDNPILSLKDLQVQNFSIFLFVIFILIMTFPLVFSPIITLRLYFQIIKATNYRGWTAKVIDITYPVSEAGNLRVVIDNLCKEAEEASKEHNFLILSDRRVGTNRIPVGALLAAGAVHHHLIACRTRSRCALIVESGEVREVHQICCLLGFGTDAIAPYLVFEIVQMWREEKVIDTTLTDEAAYSNYKGAVDRGISKIMAKMGISVLQSYKGAQVNT